ncbi:MAG TPA: hypothetical protein VMV10_18060 [Pirellulales bacterium]|nr:hypothetical protein [Pirellulales bacterium]
MSDSITGNTAPRQRFWQFRLRSLLIVVCILSIVCAWVGSKFAAKRRERLAVAYVERLGGSVAYLWQETEDASNSGPQAPGPKWLRKWLGDDAFAKLDYIDLSGTETTDDDVARLAASDGLATIEGIYLAGVQVSDAGTQSLTAFRKLKEVDLSRTAVGDAGVEHLKALPDLTSVNLAGSKVTDAGIAKLIRSKDLEFLNLSNTSITDAILPEIAKQPGLKELDISRTRVTDRGLAALVVARNLSDLGLDLAHVSDNGLAALQRLPKLRNLNFDRFLPRDQVDRLERTLHVSVNSWIP